MTTGTFLAPDGVGLSFEVAGAGPPVLWQHGLGATSAQPAEVFPPDAPRQRITLICRGHAGSELGDPARLSIAQFAEDALALLDHLGIERATLGGISLGTALALRLAVLHPERATALVLARPVWVDEAAPATMQTYVELARLLASHGAVGRALFQSGASDRALSVVSPDNAGSLVSFFARPEPATTIALLSRIPLEGPGVTLTQIKALTLPTLVLVIKDDHVHPAASGARLAGLVRETPESAPTRPGRPGVALHLNREGAQFIGVAALLQSRDHPATKAALAFWAEAVAMGLANAAHLFDPDRSVLGGPLSALYPKVAPLVETHLAALMLQGHVRPGLQLARFGTEGAAIGAALRLRERLFTLPDLEGAGPKPDPVALRDPDRVSVVPKVLVPEALAPEFLTPEVLAPKLSTIVPASPFVLPVSNRAQPIPREPR